MIYMYKYDLTRIDFVLSQQIDCYVRRKALVAVLLPAKLEMPSLCGNSANI